MTTLEKIQDTIKFARFQKKEGNSNYSKILILGNMNIYWAHPFYQHSDYNKSIAMPLNKRTVKIAGIINKYLCS